MTEVVRVLVIEDNPADVELVREYLPVTGLVRFEIESVARLSEALARLNEKGIDLILIDLGLPDSQGLETFLKLRKAAPETPAIILTGYEDEETAVTTVRNGAQDYLIKSEIGSGNVLARAARYAVERKRVAEALRSEKMMLARTEGVAHVGSWVWDIATDTVTWSDELFRIFQRDPREGAPSFAEHPAFYHPDDMVRLGQAVEVAVADGIPYELELRAIRKDGETRACVARGVAEMAQGGRPVRLFGSLQDITDRKKAEEAMEVERALLRTLIDNIPDNIFIKDTQGRIILDNLAHRRILGRQELDEVVGKSDRDFFAPALADRYMDDERGIVESGRPLINYEEPVVDPEGRPHWYLTTKVPVRDSHGNITALVGINRDITERKRAEEEIRVALREKEALLREIHHRVKNNMQVIASLFNLQARHTLNEDGRAILKEAQARIHTMSLVHEKLYRSGNLSRIDLGGYIYSLALHLFHAYEVKSGLVRLETDFEDATLDITSAIPCGLLLNELISNALKHAFPENRAGVVRIGLKRGMGGLIEVRVADDGVGFPENLDFRKAESLGLQIVNLLVGQLDGTIEMDQTNGTAFTVAFRELEYPSRA